MSRPGHVRRVTWRVALAILLLGWVFHSIFLNEGRESWQRRGGDWEALDRIQQWRVAWTHGPRELGRTLTLLHPGWGLLSVGAMGLTILLGALRWRMMLAVPGLELAPARALELTLVAHFFNAFLLGSTGGDLMKAYYAARETHHLKTEAATTVFVDRLVGLLSMLAFAVLMMLPNHALVTAHGRLAGLAGVIVLMLLGGLLVAGLSFRGGLSRHWPTPREWLRRLPKSALLERSIEACRQYGRDPGLLCRAAGVSMLLNFACVLQIWGLGRGLGLNLELMPLLVIVPSIICLAALPLTPSGLGVRENLYVWMLTVPAIGVPATQALSLSLLAYAGSLVWSFVGGIVYVLYRERPAHPS